MNNSNKYERLSSQKVDQRLSHPNTSENLQDSDVLKKFHTTQQYQNIIPEEDSAGSSINMGPKAFKSFKNSEQKSYRKYKEIVQIDLHSLLSNDEPFTKGRTTRKDDCIEDLEEISSKQSSVAFDHDQLLEQIGLHGTKEMEYSKKLINTDEEVISESQPEQQEQQQPILQINIQMKETTEVINLFKNENPREVAKTFVAKYPDIMSEQAVDILTQQITQKLQEMNTKNDGDDEDVDPMSSESVEFVQESPEFNQQQNEQNYDQEKDELSRKDLTIISDKSSDDDISRESPSPDLMSNLEKRAANYLIQPVNTRDQRVNQAYTFNGPQVYQSKSSAQTLTTIIEPIECEKVLKQNESLDVFTKSQGRKTPNQKKPYNENTIFKNKSLSPRIIKYSNSGYQSQVEFLKFKDIKEQLQLLGPKKDSRPPKPQENLTTSRSAGNLTGRRQPLGLRMYNQAQVYAQHKEQLKQHYDQQQFQKEMAESSFHPNIMTHPRYQQVRDPYTKPEDILMYKLHQKAEKIEMLKKEANDRFLEECNNFRPKINKKSMEIDRRKVEKMKLEMVQDGTENIIDGSSEEEAAAQSVADVQFNRFYALYLQGLQNKLRREQSPGKIDRECTFQPNTHKRQRKDSTDEEPIVPEDNWANQLTFMQQQNSVWNRLSQRVQQYPSKLDRRLNPQKYNLVENTDPKTGQPFFKPKILAKSPEQIDGAKSARSELNPKYISEYLYRHGQIMEQKRANIRENHLRKQEEEMKQNPMNPVSKEIFNNKLRVKLSLIFDYFDINQNGKISADEIELEKVPMEIIVIFKPLLLEMEAYQESLDREEFIESSLALLQTIPLDQKYKILNFGKVPKPQNNPTFKPKLSKLSMEIIKQKNSSRDPVQQRLLDYKSHQQKQLEYLKQQKLATEMLECSFTPRIHRSQTSFIQTKSVTRLRSIESKNRLDNFTVQMFKQLQALEKSPVKQSENFDIRQRVKTLQKKYENPMLVRNGIMDQMTSATPKKKMGQIINQNTQIESHPFESQNESRGKLKSGKSTENIFKTSPRQKALLARKSLEQSKGNFSIMVSPNENKHRSNSKSFDMGKNHPVSYAQLAQRKKSLEKLKSNLDRDLQINQSGGIEHYASIRNVSVIDASEII